MSVKEIAVSYINDLPEDTVTALLPLLKKLTDSFVYFENITFEELTDDEKEAVIQGRKDYDDGNYVDFEDYITQRNDEKAKVIVTLCAAHTRARR